MRLKLQVEAKPLVGPGSDTIGDCQKKDRAEKIWQGTHTPCSLASCEEALGVRQHAIFENKATSFFVSDNTMLYDMLIAQSRRLIWFYLLYSRLETQFLLHWAGPWV